MAEGTLPIEGGCRCGKVRFRITQPPLLTMACHCTGCQKMSGSALSTTVMAPSAGFEVTAGEPVIGGLHGERARHHHCDWSQRWLSTRIEPDMGFANVRRAALDDPTWFAPLVKSYTSEMQPWATPGARPHFPKTPQIA